MPYTVILTSANPDNDLTALTQEFSSLESSFNAVSADIVRTIINRNAIDRGIFNAYLANSDIRLFHFSGHAGDGSLLLQDGRLAHGGILAAMMREAKYLQLVFLNGCATYELVNSFLEAGAKLVIATDAPVGDKKAAIFSSLFYKEFCERKLSIGQAFDLAKLEFLKNASGPNVPFGQTRHISKKATDGNGVFLWGIYHKVNISDNEKTNREAWTLLNENFDQNPVDYRAPALELVKKLADAAIKEYTSIPVEKQKLIISSIREYRPQAIVWTNNATDKLITGIENLILSPLKAPFKEIIKIAKEDKRIPVQWPLERYERMLVAQIEFHHAFVKTFTIIMWSDFMELLLLVKEKSEIDNDSDIIKTLKKKLVAHQQLKFEINELIKGNTNMTNYAFCVNLCRKIISFMRDNEYLLNKIFKERPIGPFINESINPLDNETIEEIAKLEVLYQTLDVLDDKINRSEKENLKIYNYRVEYAIIDLVKRFSYILKYELITIGSVQAQAERLNAARKYLHSIFTDEGTDNEEYTQSTYEEGFAEGFSVLLVKNKRKFLYYLSLSPFLIDVGAFMEENVSHLLFFKKKEIDHLRYEMATSGGREELVIHLKRDADEIDFCSLPISIIGMYNNRDDEVQRRFRKRLAMVREQYKKFEEFFDEITS